MPLSKSQIRSLEKVISIAKDILNSPAAAASATSSRKRRSGKDLVEFRKMLIGARTEGASVAALAKEHGVSAAYIYQLPVPKKAKAKKVSVSKKAQPKKRSAAKKAAPKKASKKASAK